MEVMSMVGSHAAKIAERLLKNRDEDASFWDWLEPGKPLSRIAANKFLLGSILDYQMNSELVWGNARRLAEDILGDPDSLWETITAPSLDGWNAKRKDYSLHRFPKGHERVYTIGTRVVERYSGDARNIWAGQSLDATMHRLHELGVGQQIARMIAGALLDAGQIHGKGDVKVDVHVRRVLGRLLHGKPFPTDSQALVIETTRAMCPENPWLLDRPLYRLGKSVCIASAPKCEKCYMMDICAYRMGSA
jgi:endonuclease III